MADISTKPYMIRAIHEWCTDSGLTPYIAVTVDEHTLVPFDFVRAGEIVLNISGSATNRLEISNELIQFQARFNGRAQDLSIPVENVSAIYARENGHGMAFDVPSLADDQVEPNAPRLVSAEDIDLDSEETDPQVEPSPVAPPRARPALAAVPVADAPVRAESDEPGPESPDGETDPTDDGPAPSGDNNGAARRPRGKPKLTRVK